MSKVTPIDDTSNFAGNLIYSLCTMELLLPLRGQTPQIFIEKHFFLKKTFLDYSYTKFPVDFDYDV